MEYPIISVPFELGRTVATHHVMEAVPRVEIIAALYRHQNCDWGDVCPQVKFWIITEWDRSATTVLLPEDY